mmetsp:Transcript_119551/g.338355  ORF Transcript_119551/g.338355 Transcript_119551/m.338355 type:complete len:203 (+) Transcript_119551:3079-3687(+)
MAPMPWKSTTWALYVLDLPEATAARSGNSRPQAGRVLPRMLGATAAARPVPGTRLAVLWALRSRHSSDGSGLNSTPMGSQATAKSPFPLSIGGAAISGARGISATWPQRRPARFLFGAACLRWRPRRRREAATFGDSHQRPQEWQQRRLQAARAASPPLSAEVRRQGVWPQLQRPHPAPRHFAKPLSTKSAHDFFRAPARRR